MDKTKKGVEAAAAGEEVDARIIIQSVADSGLRGAVGIVS